MVTLLQSAAPVAASYISNDTRPNIVGLSRTALTDVLAVVGIAEKQRRMRMRQLWHWM